MSEDYEYERQAAERLAEKINRLFEAVHPPERGPYSNNEVEEYLLKTKDQGPTISANYLRYLRRAERMNPGAQQLRAIARFFEIDPGYLLTEDEKTEQMHEQLHKLALLRNAAVEGIATRAASLDPATQQWLLQVVNTMPARGEGPGKPGDDDQQ
ncbi:transcriptional regulator [Saccharopolyspora taberi]|uniref:XRE family transcriptional regulator n=1 Tax=Saccharopolyspora taberi TaxID=60895 RepID=A0ABN3VFS9_9PSEU